MTLEKKMYEGPTGRELPVYYRPGSSDEDVLAEVIDRRCYRRSRIGFDVEPGESWLDLGANIGAFVVYAHLRGAEYVHAFEPMEDCLEVLRKNITKLGKMRVGVSPFTVTNKRDKTITFYTKANPLNHWRGTIVPVHGYEIVGEMQNVYAGDLRMAQLAPRGDLRVAQLAGGCDRYDGVKMDIEGSEFGIIDDGLLPRAEKLVLEYHITRDERSLPRFRQRMKKLRDIYRHVHYAPSVDKGGALYQGRFDFLVHCWGRW